MHTKIIVYCSPFPDGSGKVIPTGCDHSNASKTCLECQMQAQAIAEERLAVAKHSNPFFNEP